MSKKNKGTGAANKQNNTPTNDCPTNNTPTNDCPSSQQNKKRDQQQG